MTPFNNAFTILLSLTKINEIIQFLNYFNIHTIE